MIPTRKSGFIAPVLGLVAENRRNRLSINILHINGSRYNQAESRSIKVNQGQSRQFLNPNERHSNPQILHRSS
jgi:hypothetical protein